MTWPWATIWRAAQMVAADAEAAQDVVQPRLEELDHRVGGVALGLLGDVQEAAELLLEHAVVVAELLLFGEAHAVLGVAAAAVAVHAGEREFLGGVLGDVGDRNADATGQLDLRTEVTAHVTQLFLRALLVDRDCAQNMRSPWRARSSGSYVPCRRAWF